MGTVYLHPKYDEIFKLLKKYDPNNTVIAYGSKDREMVLRAKDYKDNIVEKFEDHEFKYESMEWDDWMEAEVEN